MKLISECLCCGSTRFDNPMQVREMMFGTREVFDYHQCSNCATLQITNTISDLGPYYPSNYWFHPSRIRQPLKNFLRAVRAKLLLSDTIVSLIVARYADDGYVRQMMNYGLKSKDRILEVGCGSGDRLVALAELGFRTAHGVDPFIAGDLNENGIHVRKAELSDISGQYDFVIFHHSFEHIPNPLEALRHVAKLLSPNGVCVIRIPTCSSEAFEHYGKNWVQIDAPRHFFTPSRMGMATIGERAELKLHKTIDDSNGFSFWASEQYKRDIPLRSQTSAQQNHSTSTFSSEEIRSFEKRAIAANTQSKGDQAAFVFRHVSQP